MLAGKELPLVALEMGVTPRVLGIAAGLEVNVTDHLIPIVLLALSSRYGV